MIPLDARIVLDTYVLVKILQGKALGTAINERYQLQQRPTTPLISVVTVGELRAFSRSAQWGADKKSRLDALLAEFVQVDISSPDVINAYADLSTFLKSRGRAVGDNDRWIAATARVLQATVLTNDGDFSPLHPDQVSVELVDEAALLADT
ncbi:MAG: type II toxin-antitoxin system VapC family toxin [Gemmatimonadaceae bacterium]